MTITPFNQLSCPLDGLPLECRGSTWFCETGHSFDVAKKGYINLLPVQNKRSSDPGDHKEMVAARQRFLAAGHYQPIAGAVNKQVLQNLSLTDSFSCFDAGCGEGYYLRELAAAVSDEKSIEMIGLDISKWAVLAAARQEVKGRWIVGSNANIPVLSNSLDCVLCLFGFPTSAEFSRVLKPGGIYLQVESGDYHLRELRDIIYEKNKPERQGEKSLPEQFDYICSENVNYLLELKSQGSINDLLAMTPHLYRAKAEGRAKAAALKELMLTVDVRVSVFLKKAEQNHCS